MSIDWNHTLKRWRGAPRDGSLAWHSALALISALLLIFAFPTYDWHWLAWVALVPLLLALGGEITRRRALWLGWLTGIVWIFATENWIAHSMIFFGDFLAGLAYGIALLFAAILAIFPGLFAIAQRHLVIRFGWKAFGAAPFVWAASEWVRQWVTGVTWNGLGISQVANYRIARLSQYGGVALVSAEVVAVSAAIILATRLKQRATGRMASLLLMGAALLCFLPSTAQPIRGAAGAMVTVVGVQPNLPPNGSDDPESFNRDLEANLALTREAIERTPDKAADLVVWAESPLTLFHDNDEMLRERLGKVARETGSYLLVNTVAREGNNLFNSINIVDPHPLESDQHLTAERPQMKRYDKIRLVPFGEYVPFRPLLGRFVPTITGDFTPGKDFVVNLLRLETKRSASVSADSGVVQPAIERTTNFIRVGGFICYEAAYPELVRGFVRQGATLLVNVSNDAWFGNTAGARQHLAHARMRAIETNRDIVRVTNSGVSALLTAEGEIVDELPSFIAGTQVWQARARRDITVYVRQGEWFALSCLGLTLLLLASTAIKSRADQVPR